jgi:NADH-ubiquinone oxidoreductase chain 5
VPVRKVLRWIIFYTPSIICLPLYLKLLAFFVSLLGGWVGYELSRFSLRDSLISLSLYRYIIFSGSIWFMPCLSTYGTSLSPLFLGYYSLRVSDLGWAERFGGQGIYWLFIWVVLISGDSIIILRCFLCFLSCGLLFWFLYLFTWISCVRVRHWRCCWGFIAFKCIYEILFVFTVKV